MILKAVCLLAIGFSTEVNSSVAASPRKGFGTNVGEIKCPTQSAPIFGLLGLVDQSFRYVWSSAVLLGLSFAPPLGFGLRSRSAV